MASLGTSFGSSGATPAQSYGGLFNSGSPTTPYGKALANPIVGQITPSTPNVLKSVAGAIGNMHTNANTASLTGANPQTSIYTGLLNTPSTALKSTTITQPDGTVVKQEHHAPDEGTSTPSDPSTIPSTQTPPSVTPTTPTTPPIYDAQGQLTDYGRAQQKPTTPTAPSQFSGLISQGVESGKQAADIGKQAAIMENNAEHNPNYSLDTGLGISGEIARNLGAEQAGAAQESAASFAGANVASPVQVSPGSTLVNPSEGNAIYGLGTGAGGNGGDAYQNFANLQFNTATGQSLSKQANDLTTAANQTDQNFNTLSQAASGLNLSDYPTINSLSQALQKQGGNAGQVAALNEAYNALTTSLGAIIGSNADVLTPTLISHLIGNQSINSLSPAQLQTLYQTVQKTMATKISTVQQQALQAEKSGTNFNNGAPNSSLYDF